MMKQKQRARKLTVVFGPPANVVPTDEIVKDKADEHTGHKVEECRWRQEGRGDKDEREVDVFEEIHPKLLMQNPLE